MPLPKEMVKKKVQRNSKYDENKTVPLDGILSEFREAIQKEIDAASNNESNSAVQLINGRKIAQIGNAYQYIFEVENALNLPGDTPGDLYVTGRNPIEVIIISIEGMAITLSIPEDIGNFVPIAKLQSNLTFLMRKLIERIESKADIPNPVGDHILGDFPDDKPFTTAVSDDGLNTQQNEAVISSLNRDITFIGGPPGTGKTRTIGNIGNELYLAERATLLVSHTNTAVDGAIKIIGKFIDKEELAQGKVVRVGEPKDSTLDAELLLSTHVDRRSDELAERKQKLEHELTNLIAKAKENFKTLDIYEWVMETPKDISCMDEELNVLKKTKNNIQALRDELGNYESQIEKWNEAAKAAEIAQRHLVNTSRGE